MHSANTKHKKYYLLYSTFIQQCARVIVMNWNNPYGIFIRYFVTLNKVCMVYMICIDSKTGCFRIQFSPRLRRGPFHVIENVIQDQSGHQRDGCKNQAIRP